MMTDAKLNVEEIESRLLDLGTQIERVNAARLCHVDQEKHPEWLGADVWVTSNLEADNDPDTFNHDLIVRTRYAPELSWLFMELRDTFAGWLDYRNKYGFYESHARAALQHLATFQPEQDSPEPLLKTVLQESFEWLGKLRAFSTLPTNPGIVIHQTDAEGQQKRITPEELL